MVLHRTQVLLQPDQYRELTALARREGRSMSELVRQAVERDLERRRAEQADLDARWEAAFRRAHELSAQILARRGGRKLDLDTAELIREMRDERDEEIIANTALRFVDRCP